MKKTIALLTFIFLFGISYLYSQTGNHLSILYEMSFGTGDLGEYISQPSFRGASLQYRYAVNDNVMVGGDLGWNVFYEKMDYDSYTAGTATLSGVQWRTQNMVPVMVAADYVFIPDGRTQPYAGIGLGTIYSERSTDMGIWRLKENPWHFALKPEVGVLIQTSSGTAFQVAAKYLTGFSAGDLETQGYFTIGIGMAFGMR